MSAGRITAAALVAGLLALGLPVAAAAAAPTVSDTWASGVGLSTVDLHATVNPNGVATSVRAEYISAASYQANLAAVPPRDGFSGALRSPASAGVSIGAGSLDVEFSRHVGGLAAGTSYRYRVVAGAEAGSGVGLTRTFTTTENSPLLLLPDERGWEMVSPVDKNGGEIQAAGGNFGGGVLQASADGGSVTYSSASSFAPAIGGPGASQYISRRGSGGWGTENVTTATLAGAYGPEPEGVPYQLFSTDLSRGLLSLPSRCADAPCPRRYALRSSADGVLSSSAETTDLGFSGASPDLAQVILSTCAALTADATEASQSGSCLPNLYRWDGGAPALLNLLPGDSQGTPGAVLAARAGAVSPDGSRVYFSSTGDLYLRRGTETVQVDAGQGGGGTFETASADASIAFFSKAGHLYRYSAATGAVADLTPAGEVQGVLGTSADGTYLYYLAGGGLYLWHGGAVTEAAADADASNFPPATGTARIAANGNLAFLSSAPLTEADGGGLPQVYLYEPAGGILTCASCNPSGARPSYPASIPGATANGSLPGAARLYKPRSLTAGGTRIFFETREALVPTDTNGDEDVYQWEAQGTGSYARLGGCIDLISSGRSKDGASFLDASADGADAFFLTDGSLVSSDPGVVDVYDARIGGGFPDPVVPIACVSDACQVIPGEPEDPSVATGFYRPEGNPKLSFSKHRKKHRKHRKKGRHEQKAHGKRAGR
jgi:hypothetical protein